MGSKVPYGGGSVASHLKKRQKKMPKEVDRVLDRRGGVHQDIVEVDPIPNRLLELEHVPAPRLPPDRNRVPIRLLP